MGDVADILGIKAEKSSDSGGLSSAAGAKDAPKKKKPVGMSREVFALVNALPRRPRSDILAYQTARKYEADALLLFPRRSETRAFLPWLVTRRFCPAANRRVTASCSFWQIPSRKMGSQGYKQKRSNGPVKWFVTSRVMRCRHLTSPGAGIGSRSPALLEMIQAGGCWN
jgi:hypothetical protein